MIIILFEYPCYNLQNKYQEKSNINIRVNNSSHLLGFHKLDETNIYIIFFSCIQINSILVY